MKFRTHSTFDKLTRALRVLKQMVGQSWLRVSNAILMETATLRRQSQQRRRNCTDRIPVSYQRRNWNWRLLQFAIEFRQNKSGDSRKTKVVCRLQFQFYLLLCSRPPATATTRASISPVSHQTSAPERTSVLRTRLTPFPATYWQMAFVWQFRLFNEAFQLTHYTGSYVILIPILIRGPL